MIFWRLRSLPVRAFRARQADMPARTAVLESIAANARAGRFPHTKIAWDGLEAWERIKLIGAPQIDGVTMQESAMPASLAGPFGAAKPEPAKYAFFESPYDDDDIFDSLWRSSPSYAAAADWLADKPAEIWMAAVDELEASHPHEIYEWMVLQPGCPSSVAGQIFWLQEPPFHGQQLLEGTRATGASRGIIDHVLARWRKNDFLPCDLDFSRYSKPAAYRALLERFPGRADPLEIPQSLLDPPKGRAPGPIRLGDDFDFWCIRSDLAGLVPRGRDRALAAWKASKGHERQERERARADATAATLLERLFYGGRFTGAKADMDRAWKRFNLIAGVGAVVVIALWRVGAPPIVPFLAFLALVVVVSVFLSSANMGGARRTAVWWTGAVLISMTLAFVFRWIDQ